MGSALPNTEKESMMSWIRTLSLSLLLVAAPAAALPTINFDQGTGGGQAGGTLSYDGEGGPLIGTNIGFGVLAGFDTTLNTGVPLFCVPNCQLDFTTGANTAEAVAVPGGLQQWTWDGGGSFVVEGTLNTAADGTGLDVASGTLLSGTFDGALGLVGPAGRLAVIGVGEDEKIGGLLDFYGIPDFLPFRFADTEIVATSLTVGANGSLDGTVTNADLTNTGIPEPGTLLLFGSGAAGVAMLRRWRRR
jgi:PEP-CTERM motif